MSLSRSPSPQRSGGWSSPGLTTPYNSNSRRSSPIRSYANGSANNVTWATAQARSDQVRSFSPRNQGFSRHFQGLSSRLPHFNSRDYSDKEKLGRGRWSSSAAASRLQNVLAFLGRVIWRMRLRFAAVLAFLLLIMLFYATRGYSDTMLLEHLTNYTQLYIESIGKSPTSAAEKNLS
jgi:mannan polymerase II complex MNN10 subunit